MNSNVLKLALIILISTIAVVFAAVRFRQFAHYFSTFASGTIIAGARVTASFDSCGSVISLEL